MALILCQRLGKLIFMNKHLLKYAENPRFFGKSSWFLDVRIDQYSLTLNDNFKAGFPEMSSLLALAQSAKICHEGGDYLLLAWTCKDSESIGWLCEFPSRDSRAPICDTHQIWAALVGGILDYWGEGFDSILANQRSFLSTKAFHEVDTYETLNACQNAGIINTDLENIVVVSEEYNGNLVFYVNSSEAVYYYAPDHCDALLVPVCQGGEYSLYTRPDTPNVRTVIEKLSRQWLRRLSR